MNVENLLELFRHMNTSNKTTALTNTASGKRAMTGGFTKHALLDQTCLPLFVNVGRIVSSDTYCCRQSLHRSFHMWITILEKHQQKTPQEAWKDVLFKVRKSPSKNLEVSFEGTDKLGMHIVNDLAKKDRVLFLTGENNIGNGPAATRAGDEIFLIWGVSMPVILRRSGGAGYRFIGGADVQGMMKSERWKDVNVEDLEAIALC